MIRRTALCLYEALMCLTHNAFYVSTNPTERLNLVPYRVDRLIALISEPAFVHENFYKQCD